MLFYEKYIVSSSDVVRPSKSLPQASSKKASSSFNNTGGSHMKIVYNDLSDDISDLCISIPEQFKSHTDRGSNSLQKQMKRLQHAENISQVLPSNSETAVKLAFEPRTMLYLPAAVLSFDLDGSNAFIEYIGRSHRRWVKVEWLTEFGKDYDKSCLNNFSIPRFHFRKRRHRTSSIELVEDWDDNPFPQVHDKYWSQRYRYFIEYDAGIQLDAESWYSVTPEIIARHTASRCAEKVVLDAFCGCGGNTIQFAKFSSFVYGIDIDPVKVDMASHNARIYNVFTKIDLLVADSLTVLQQFESIVDVIVLAPPWGGMNYIDSPTFSLSNLRLGHMSGIELFNMAKKIAPNIIYLLPRNYDGNEVELLAQFDDNPSEYFELQDNYLGGKLKMKVLYFGDLFK